MSGGSWESVMGNRAKTIGSSGFDSGFFTVINNQKYYDLYTAEVFKGNSETDYNYCGVETCGGHALSETKSWYGDYAYFVNSSAPWFDRGGGYSSSNSVYIGLFFFHRNIGNSSVNTAFRSVLIPKSIGELQLLS